MILKLCPRYRRKGRSSLGLDPRRQEVSWDESKKKHKGEDKRKADRYFSTVNRQLLRSEPAVPTLPQIPEGTDSGSRASFLQLDDENKPGETGKRFSRHTL